MPTPSILEELLHSFPRRDIIKIRSIETVEKLLVKIKDGTANSLQFGCDDIENLEQVVTDFDRTLTRHHLNGKLCDSTYGVIDHSPLVHQDFKSKTKILYDKYYAIEICHELSIAEKTPHMIKWYAESHQHMVDYARLTKPLIKVITRDCNAILRDNVHIFLEMMNEAEVPVLIFSAGMGDILHGILESQNVLFPNIKIVSNWMEFDDNGVLTGFKEPIIQIFNKNQSVMGSDKSYFSDLSNRKNVLLLGDSVGDIQMADGLETTDGILKIGFLNQNIEERLESFLNAFDIVILDDQSMDFINILLRTVL